MLVGWRRGIKAGGGAGAAHYCSMKGERRVVVVGAGYSGLTTAAELTLRGWTVDIKVHNVLFYG